MSEPDLSWEVDYDDVEVPVSALEHFSYCPRQCALIHVEQIFDENVFTIRGALAHERVDQVGNSNEGGVRVVRGLPIFSDHLGLRGRADIVEFRPEGPYPVEYKVGRRHGRHAELQLCAQALCLEDMLRMAVPRGAVYYRAHRRRHEVEFSAQLRAATLEAVLAVRTMIRRRELPPAPNDARCPNCSLINSCLPWVVGEPSRMRGLQGALFRPMVVGDGDV